MRGRTESMLWGTIVPCADPHGSAGFYARLLGWVLATDEPGWVTLQPPGGGAAYLGFQLAQGHALPVWPPPDGHTARVLRFEVAPAQVPGAIWYAVSLGARVAPQQPRPDVTILLDPAGHPFAFAGAA